MNKLQRMVVVADTKDLDFDELDKAVNSLMGTVEDKELVQKSKTLDINETLAPNEAPAYRHLDEAAKKIGNEAIDNLEQTVSLNDEGADGDSQLPPLQPSKKPGGRFMDVVHPSSDMRSTITVAPRKVSREGVSIAPTNDPVSEPPATTTGNLPPAEESMAELETTDKEKPTIELSESLPPLSSIEPVSSDPLTSPFLPDAKVEKRPLGGVETVPKPEEEPKQKDDAMNSTPEAETEKEMPDISEWTPLIPEPSKEDDIDSDNDIKLDTEDELPKKKDDEFSKMDAMDEAAKNLTEVTEHIPEEFKNELLEVEKVDTPSVVTGPIGVASIPKQYQEKPSSGDQTNGAIYDTDHYHKPVAHPTTQKSGWTWVLAVIILIIVGAALGATAYFFGLV